MGLLVLVIWNEMQVFRQSFISQRSFELRTLQATTQVNRGKKSESTIYLQMTYVTLLKKKMEDLRRKKPGKRKIQI